MTLPTIPTASEIDAMTDAEYVARCATGPVIDAADIAAQLDAGNRVYAVDRVHGGIARIQWAGENLDGYAGFYVGASSVSIGRA